jgi:anti-sigma regulatory factor (Ser/Thr protein kinase)
VAHDSVTLRFPASTERVRLARTMVATLADDAGFDYDEVEDLRIAVDELCFILIEGCAEGGEIELVAESQPGDLVVVGTSTAPPATDAGEPPEITVQILRTVVDDYELVLDGSARFRFHKSKP